MFCFAGVSISRPLFSGTKYGYTSYLEYTKIFALDFMMDIRLKFTIKKDVSLAMENSLMLFTGQKGKTCRLWPNS